MGEFVDAIRVALGVWEAVTNGRQPVPEDVEELRKLAPAGELTQMANRVVEEALQRLREKRQAGGA